MTGGAPAGEYRFPRIDDVKFGPGSARTLATTVDRLGAERVLIVTGTTLATKTDLVDRLGGILGDRLAGVFSDTRQHVHRERVIAATNAAREAEVDCLVSFGGSSPIDTAKLTALCLAAGVERPEQMDSLRFREEEEGSTGAEMRAIEIPHVAISTTLSAGEFTPFAGATDTKRGAKDAYGTPGMTPTSIILDPELTLATPRELWATTGMKAFDHAVETVCSTRPQPLADALALRAIEMLADSLLPSIEGADELAHRGRCQLAAWMSILSLASVPFGLSHALGHQLGARCDVPHGVTSCILLPRVMDFNRPATAPRQRLIAEAMRIDVGGMDDDAAAAAASATLRAIVARLGVKTELREWGVSEDDLLAISSDSIEDFMSMTNPRPIESSADVLEILRSVY